MCEYPWTEIHQLTRSSAARCAPPLRGGWAFTDDQEVRGRGPRCAEHPLRIKGNSLRYKDAPVLHRHCPGCGEDVPTA
eukprot:gene9748-12163_t